MGRKNSFNPNALILLIITCVAVFTVFVAETLLEDKIAHNKQGSTIKLLEGLMPYPYDNDLLADKITITLPTYFGTQESATIYRAMLDEEPVGVVFSPIKASGYNAMIDIAVGIKEDGVITGVRILAHRETAGLGDGIDQDKSDWISSFTGRSLDNTEKQRWAVRKDGGEFDQLSGATLSPRAVIHAVQYTLNYYALNKDWLYSQQRIK